MDIFGDSNDLTFTGSGYGASANDAAYFYLDLEGDSNTMVIKQQSTLAADWLKIESNTSNCEISIKLEIDSKQIEEFKTIIKIS